ncbi:MAG: dihydropteroate synthase [Acidobacteriota bacterium]
MHFLFRGGAWDLGAGGPRIMGVLNVTPDSFSDGGRYLEAEAAVERALQMEEEGADVVDIGGESTRPGSDHVSAEEELSRVLPVIDKLAGRLKIPLSIDTSRAVVAQQAIRSGASIVNDVTAGLGEPAMLPLAASTGAGLVLMHMQGSPKTMQLNPHYGDVVAEVTEFLRARIAAAVAAGSETTSLVIDPGIGFGKGFADNVRLLHNLGSLLSLGRPIAVGTSRKSFIGAITGQAVAEARIEGSIASALFAASRGASILRVHDVAATRRAVAVWRELEIAGETVPR